MQEITRKIPKNKREMLFIASIYAPSENNITWYKLQKEYIKKTTSSNFHFVIIANGVSPELFNKGNVIHSFAEVQTHSAALA